MSETHPAEHVVVHSSGPGTGMIIGIIVAIVAIAVLAFVLMAGPGRSATTAPNTTINQTQPAAPAAPAAPGIQIPRQIDVNVNAPAPQNQQQVPAVPQAPVQLP